MNNPILETEFKNALKLAENLPQPEYMVHMNRYLEHKDEYPLTESVIKYVAEQAMPILLEITVKSEISDTKPKDKIITSMLFERLNQIQSLSFEEICSQYEVISKAPLLDIKKKIIEIRYSKCVKCGNYQEITLLPLATDRDYWICNSCGQTHSHVRLGWVAQREEGETGHA